jgi:glycosyltransferase involved in cell wall biosynthesis
MCTFNGARYLEEQLESIASQSRLPSELIVCDDQSTDETLRILKQFQTRAPFAMKVIQNSSRLGSTRNFDQAIGLTRGDLIALCDQDDRWSPTKLQRLSDVLIADPSLGGVFSDANLIDGAGRTTGQRLFARHKFTVAKQRNFINCPTAMLLKHDVVTGATLMFRSSMRKYASPIPATWIHDGWLTWIIALHARMALISEPLVDYRIHDGQQLGVNETPASSTKAESRRQFYERVAHQFEDLLHHVTDEGSDNNDALIRKIREKIEFLKSQARLSTSVGVRTFQIFSQLPRYAHYARGLGSLRTDLLLGRETS